MLARETNTINFSNILIYEKLKLQNIISSGRSFSSVFLVYYLH